MSPISKKSIYEAAIELFSEKGYDGASVRDIAHKAGVNIAAINYHYKSKADLYTEVLKTLLSSVLDKIHPTSQGTLLFDWLDSWYWELLDMDTNTAGSCFEKLIEHEQKKPTGLCEDILVEIIRPKNDHLVQLISTHIGDLSDNNETSQRLARALIDISKSYNKDKTLCAKLSPQLFEGDWKSKAHTELMTISKAIINAYTFPTKP